jgi:hypothetical protein
MNLIILSSSLFIYYVTLVYYVFITTAQSKTENINDATNYITKKSTTKMNASPQYGTKQGIVKFHHN